ncbi:MAG TPA: pyridoxal-phosphate dependent enzyme [Solirubrobacteraceae bacterium]|nr:pyridoxal-phosphate dependent enzyme [Solirubrobacteraceae bacterium]
MPAATLELLKALVAIDSVNPSLVARGAGEREIAAFIAAAGIPTILFGPRGERAHCRRGVGEHVRHRRSRRHPGRCRRADVQLRSLVNPAVDRGNVAEPSGDAAPFHTGLPGYQPTPAHALEAVADELGLAAVTVKDESNRLGLPAFKVLGASWAVERALREYPASHTLIAASAGNHGRALAHVASERGLRCRVFLPARSSERRRRAIADVGASEPAHWVIDGYQTLFAETAAQGSHDLILVPVGVGSLAAAAARFAAATQSRVIGVEPATAACLTASLAAVRALAADPACEELRRAVALGPSSRLLLIATEGLTA